MSVTVVIPARWESSRFPGKPLALIKGAGSTEEAEPKTLIRRTWDVAIASGVGRVVVATDDMRIAEHVAGFGGTWLLTPDCRNGTERCALVASALSLREEDLVINLQGDALLTPPEWLVLLKEHMETKVHPLARRWNAGTIISRPPNDREPHPGDVSAAYSEPEGHLLMFSRSRLPSRGPWWLHYGIYAYYAPLLQYFARRPPGPLETLEGLEQLRILEHAIGTLSAVTITKGRLPRCEVNYPADVPWVEEELRAWGIE